MGRFDATLPLPPLTETDLRSLVAPEVPMLNERLPSRRISIAVPDAAAHTLVAQALKNGEGARGLQRALKELVENELAGKLLAKTDLVGKKLTLRQRQQRWVLSPLVK